MQPIENYIIKIKNKRSQRFNAKDTCDRKCSKCQNYEKCDIAAAAEENDNDDTDA